jgi:hypothetical protein
MSSAELLLFTRKSLDIPQTMPGENLCLLRVQQIKNVSAEISLHVETLGG